jgi:hypothetical protein
MSVFNWPMAPDLSKMREAYRRDRRESIAREALMALLAQSEYWLPDKAAKEAVGHADALIAELDKEVQP